MSEWCRLGGQRGGVGAGGLERPVGLGPEGYGPRGFKEVAAKLVDLRGVARPPSFTGVESDWAEFRFRL
eukprot:1409754-Heterocapsa_arctica.AAC.1